MKAYYYLVIVLVFQIFMPYSAQAENTAKTIVIMDGSGSMWGQIDGKPKLEIAKEALADVLSGLPADRTLGLLAYGHRRKGDCADIQMLVSPAENNAGAISSAANAMRFLGKTPLTEAVREAAAELRSTEEAATVVLITDGIETCGGDPCALAQELEESGVDFTAHVVGFGLSEEEGAALSCLATETGGRYITADDEVGLRDALTRTIAAAAPVGKEPEVAFDLPDATLNAADSAGRATQIEIAWTGPGRDGDYIDVAPFDGAGTVSFDSVPVSGNEGTVKLALPSELGDYVLRYMTPLSEEEVAGNQDAVRELSLAVRPVTVVDVDKFLDAPNTAGQGATIKIAWGGPGNENDFIGLYRDANSLADAWIVGVAVSSGSPVQLPVPLDIGSYELRYYVSGSDGDAVLVTRPVEVIAASVGLNAPDAVRPGADFTVSWSGPAGEGDWVDLVDEGTEPVYAYEGYVEHSYGYTEDSVDSHQMVLTAPEAPGTYDLRYIGTFPQNGRDDTTERMVLYRQSISVSADAPDAASLEQAAEDGQQIDLEAADAPTEAGMSESSPQQQASGETGEDGIGEDVGYFCQEELGCTIEDAETGVTFRLYYGWGSSYPYRDGPEAPVQISFFDTRDDSGSVTLNAPDGGAAGPTCLPSKLGELCASDNPGSFLAMTMLMQTAKALD